MKYQTAEEIQLELGRRLKQLRLSRNLTQLDVAKRAAVPRSSLQKIEESGKATVETLVRVLKVFDVDGAAVVPEPPSISPIALFHREQPRQRARRGRWSR
jgi:transcriptional regulator with XRE-family HTH domain